MTLNRFTALFRRAPLFLCYSCLLAPAYADAVDAYALLIDGVEPNVRAETALDAAETLIAADFEAEAIALVEVGLGFTQASRSRAVGERLETLLSELSDLVD